MIIGVNFIVRRTATIEVDDKYKNLMFNEDGLSKIEFDNLTDSFLKDVCKNEKIPEDAEIKYAWAKGTKYCLFEE